MTDNRPGFEPQTPSERQAERESLGQLLQEVSRDLSTLFRQEVELAKAELKETAKKAGKGAGLFGGAGVAGLLALVFVSIAAWWALGYLIGNAWSALVVAAIWGIVAAVLAMTGKKEIEEIEGAPQTVETVKEIPETLKRNEENR
ncbi:phage holin family protein [Agromyces silvae]|uniref:phage holin family protein n=1 Tax=Agromyces silvae TaxID=3388266 RepID=UPI00280A6957|nr:phage holin family protein [Agromyces protaetiae]